MYFNYKNCIFKATVTNRSKWIECFQSTHIFYAENLLLIKWRLDSTWYSASVLEGPAKLYIIICRMETGPHLLCLTGTMTLNVSLPLKRAIEPELGMFKCCCLPYCANYNSFPQHWSLAMGSPLEMWFNYTPSSLLVKPVSSECSCMSWESVSMRSLASLPAEQIWTSGVGS